MIAATRYRVPETETETDGFLDLARAALVALAARPGHVDGVVGRSADDPTLWIVLTTWRGVGDYRRALSAYEVKLASYPLAHLALDEPSAFEVLLAADSSGSVVESPSDRARDEPRERRAGRAAGSEPGVPGEDRSGDPLR